MDLFERSGVAQKIEGGVEESGLERTEQRQLWGSKEQEPMDSIFKVLLLFQQQLFLVFCLWSGIQILRRIWLAWLGAHAHPMLEVAVELLDVHKECSQLSKACSCQERLRNCCQKEEEWMLVAKPTNDHNGHHLNHLETGMQRETWSSSLRKEHLTARSDRFISSP